MVSRRSDRCTLAEAAAAHDGKGTIQWLMEFYRLSRKAG